jgi:hypothetical protein
VAAQYLQSVQNALWISTISKDKKFPQIFTVLDRLNDLALFPEDAMRKTAEQSMLPYSLAGRSQLIVSQRLLLRY